MTVRGMRTSDSSQQSQCPFRTCLGSFVTKLQSIIRWQDAKKRNIGSQQIDTSQPDSFILFSESINNNPGKNTRDNNWWKKRWLFLSLWCLVCSNLIWPKYQTQCIANCSVALKDYAFNGITELYTAFILHFVLHSPWNIVHLYWSVPSNGR